MALPRTLNRRGRISAHEGEAHVFRGDDTANGSAGTPTSTRIASSPEFSNFATFPMGVCQMGKL